MMRQNKNKILQTPLTSYTWSIRKQFDWCGGVEYSIEIVEIEGCIGYGLSISEAKKSLYESFELWLRKNGVDQLPATKNEMHFIVLEQEMTIEEFDYVNIELQQLKKTIEAS